MTDMYVDPIKTIENLVGLAETLKADRDRLAAENERLQSIVRKACEEIGRSYTAFEAAQIRFKLLQEAFDE